MGVPESRKYGERALQLFIEAQKSAAHRGDDRSELGWITTAGDVYRGNGDIERAAQSYQRGLKLATEINSKRDMRMSSWALLTLPSMLGGWKKPGGICKDWARFSARTEITSTRSCNIRAG